MRDNLTEKNDPDLFSLGDMLDSPHHQEPVLGLKNGRYVGLVVCLEIVFFTF